MTMSTGNTTGPPDKEADPKPLETSLRTVPSAGDNGGEYQPQYDFSIHDGPESGWVSGLVSLNSEILPGYHSETIKRVGGGSFAALRSSFSIRVGRYGESSLIISLFISQRNSRHDIAMITIPLNKLRAPVIAEDCNPELGGGFMAEQLMAYSAYHHSSLIHGKHVRRDYWIADLAQPGEGEVAGSVDDKFPGTFIQRLKSSVTTLHFEIDASDLITHLTRVFDQPDCIVEEECRAIDAGVAEKVKGIKYGTTIDLCFRHHEHFASFWFPRLKNLGIWVSPYAPFMANARTNHTDLTFGNFIYEGVRRPDKAPSKIPMFVSDQQSTVTGIGGSIEEVELLRHRAEQLHELTLTTAIIPDPAAKWEPRPDDMDVYHMKADGAPKHQFFVIHCDEISHLFPEIGEKCHFYMVTKGERRPPRVAASSEQVENTIRMLTTEVNSARSDASVEAAEHLGTLVRGGEVLSAVIRQIFTGNLMELFLMEAEHPDQRIVDEYPSEQRTMQMLKSTALWAEELVDAWEQHGDADEYIEKWVCTHSAQHKVVVDDLGEPWYARRMALPPGTRANIALFSVFTPRQSDWTASPSKPYLNPGYPVNRPRGTLSSFLREMGKDLRMDSSNVDTIQTKMRVTPNETTAQQECAAITAMNSLPTSSLASTFKKYILDFQSAPTSLNFLNLFPQLKADLDAGLFGGEHTQVLNSLQDVGGYAFINGGPGCGKSTLAAGVARSVITGGKKILWLAPSNALVRDAVGRLQRQCPNATVRRMLTYAAELNTLLSENETLECSNSLPLGTSHAQRSLNAHADALRVRRYRLTAPSQADDSMSKLALSIAQNDTETYGKFLHFRNLSHKDPDQYVASAVDHRALARDLMGTALDKCDAICATPVAFAQMINHHPYMEFALIVVDEASKMTEPTALIPVSKKPNTPVLFVGDNKQFEPMAIARDDRTEKHIFGNQRGWGLFNRVGDAGAMSATLGQNFRARGSVADWAISYIYNGEMKVFHRKETISTLRMRKWMTDTLGLTGPNSAIYMVNLEDATEIRVGTSFANPINALFGRELVSYLYQTAPLVNLLDVTAGVNPRFGTILIIVAYTAQKTEWDGLINQLSPAEAPRQLIEVRTIDDSSSHEADLVICDLVRSGDRAGFLNDLHRLAVLATRARGTTIILGNNKSKLTRSQRTPTRSHLSQLFAWVEDNHTMVTVRSS
ncbi:P-loop containing nucleoside triphosphate hydrolase protein [Dactylonectria estremocensis]|uniref:P-loop containing nucleoside triphosphate hydrolase protein n=1 Tax=Dactylonectria estremocensis TaxID=1079267 RepID=A0A9P9FI45_9HYPO|nr:P-loop containing nucleoside triphosphate hydrolase protein [Dactylonectria estremocensis]